MESRDCACVFHGAYSLFGQAFSVGDSGRVALTLDNGSHGFDGSFDECPDPALCFIHLLAESTPPMACSRHALSRDPTCGEVLRAKRVALSHSAVLAAYSCASIRRLRVAPRPGHREPNMRESASAEHPRLRIRPPTYHRSVQRACVLR